MSSPRSGDSNIWSLPSAGRSLPREVAMCFDQIELKAASAHTILCCGQSPARSRLVRTRMIERHQPVMAILDQDPLDLDPLDLDQNYF